LGIREAMPSANPSSPMGKPTRITLKLVLIMEVSSDIELWV